jgi:hypothetical protein
MLKDDSRGPGVLTFFARISWRGVWCNEGGHPIDFKRHAAVFLHVLEANGVSGELIDRMMVTQGERSDNATARLRTSSRCDVRMKQ